MIVNNVNPVLDPADPRYPVCVLTNIYNDRRVQQEIQKALQKKTE